MRYLLAGALLVLGCGSTGQFSNPSFSGSDVPSVVVPDRYGRYFAVIEGALSETRPSAVHRVRLDADLFNLPSGQVTLLVQLEQAGQAIGLRLGEGSKGEASRQGDSLVVAAGSGDTLELQVSGLGEYRLLVSLAGDRDGDGDVDLVDGPAGLNFGVSTRVRPLEVRFALAPGREPLSQLGESLDATASFVGRTAPGASLRLEGSGRTIPVDGNGDFAFDAGLTAGENDFVVLASDDFGQQAYGSAAVDQVAESSDPPAAMSDDKKNRIWLLDAHANNYLFRGPLPLTSLEPGGRVDFASLVAVMNQRLVQQGAPISALPSEFDFTEIALISNQLTNSVSRGDEGASLFKIYSSILGSDPLQPPVDADRPTSLFTRPLDNTATPGVDVVVSGHTLHTDVIWQPVSGNSISGEPKASPGGDKGYDRMVSTTAPIVHIATQAPASGLSGPLSNISVTTQKVHSLMEQASPVNRPHIYYMHCVNGHDRTGMIATAYVLSAYGPNFGYDLGPAYEYGQMGAYLPGSVPAGVDARANFWNVLETANADTGALKKKYMRAVRSLAQLYQQRSKIQEAPALTATVPAVPLWEKGYQFTPAAGVPTLETPADYQKIRP